jgi:hypothetical protein
VWNSKKESGERIYWDERICEDASLEDIEEEKVKWYLERRGEIRKVSHKSNKGEYNQCVNSPELHRACGYESCNL